MGFNRDFEDLTPASQFKLRSATITDFFGSIVGDELKKKPIKITPYFLPLPLIPSLSMMVIAAATLAQRARSASFREHFRDISQKPINVKFFESAMKECPKTGQIYACSKALFGRRLQAIKNGANYLTEYHLERLLPNSGVKRFTQWAHEKLTRYPFPAILEESHDDHSMKGKWKGAVFALAGLAHTDSSDIVAHLHGPERTLFEQEYATLEA